MIKNIYILTVLFSIVSTNNSHAMQKIPNWKTVKQFAGYVVAFVELDPETGSYHVQYGYIEQEKVNLSNIHGFILHPLSKSQAVPYTLTTPYLKSNGLTMRKIYREEAYDILKKLKTNEVNFGVQNSK